jgi:hypothetical protein
VHRPDVAVHRLASHSSRDVPAVSSGLLTWA